MSPLRTEHQARSGDDATEHVPDGRRAVLEATARTWYRLGRGEDGVA